MPPAAAPSSEDKQLAFKAVQACADTVHVASALLQLAATPDESGVVPGALWALAVEKVALEFKTKRVFDQVGATREALTEVIWTGRLEPTSAASAPLISLLKDKGSESYTRSDAITWHRGEGGLEGTTARRPFTFEKALVGLEGHDGRCTAMRIEALGIGTGVSLDSSKITPANIRKIFDDMQGRDDVDMPWLLAKPADGDLPTHDTMAAAVAGSLRALIDTELTLVIARTASVPTKQKHFTAQADDGGGVGTGSGAAASGNATMPTGKGPPAVDAPPSNVVPVLANLVKAMREEARQAKSDDDDDAVPATGVETSAGADTAANPPGMMDIEKVLDAGIKAANTAAGLQETDSRVPAKNLFMPLTAAETARNAKIAAAIAATPREVAKAAAAVMGSTDLAKDLDKLGGTYTDLQKLQRKTADNNSKLAKRNKTLESSLNAQRNTTTTDNVATMQNAVTEINRLRGVVSGLETELHSTKSELATERSLVSANDEELHRLRTTTRAQQETVTHLRGELERTMCVCE
jgi:hypothetical protein